MMVQPFKKVNKKPIIPREQHLCLYIIRNRYYYYSSNGAKMNSFERFFDDGYHRRSFYFITHKNISNTHFPKLNSFESFFSMTDINDFSFTFLRIKIFLTLLAKMFSSKVPIKH
jgi:hypothetical protein